VRVYDILPVLLVAYPSPQTENSFSFYVCDQDLSGGADSVDGQIQGVTSYGRVWRKGAENEAWSVKL